MNIEDMLEINDCPLCDGGALWKRNVAAAIM